ncbi:hypothetical protein PMAYCL1PPCAC_01873, partial [Pristionchus mayeri]
DRSAPLYTMDDRNGPDIFDNIQMVPVFLASLEDDDGLVAEVAAESLRKILERADREFLRNNYATAMESFKGALTNWPWRIDAKAFDFRLFTDLIHCVHSLAKAVGEEGFKEDSAEVF